MSESVELDFTELFQTVNEMLQVFTESRRHPRANCGDIYVEKLKCHGKLFAFRVNFMIGFMRDMGVEMDVSICSKNPKRYMEEWIEIVNEAYKQATRDLDAPSIYLPRFVPNALAQAINTSGVLH